MEDDRQREAIFSLVSQSFLIDAKTGTFSFGLWFIILFIFPSGHLPSDGANVGVVAIAERSLQCIIYHLFLIVCRMLDGMTRTHTHTYTQAARHPSAAFHLKPIRLCAGSLARKASHRPTYAKQRERTIVR